jgi:hypothetical protein
MGNVDPPHIRLRCRSLMLRHPVPPIAACILPAGSILCGIDARDG